MRPVGAERVDSPAVVLRQEHRRAIAIAWQLARLDLVRRYTATMLGLVWAVLSPLLMACVIGIVFARVFGVDTRTFLPYLFLNLTLWAFFNGCLDGGAIAFLSAEGYIKQVPGVSLFTYPLRMTLAAFVTLALGLVAVTAVILALGGSVGLAWLWVLPGLGAWFAFGFAVACLSGICNTAVRDVQYIQAVAVQALFYATPVMFPAELLLDHGLSWMLTYNPLYHLMMLVRVPMLSGVAPPAPHFVASGATLAAVGALAYVAVKRARLRLVYWL